MPCDNSQLKLLSLHLQFEKFDRQQIIAMILTPTS